MGRFCLCFGKKADIFLKKADIFKICFSYPMSNLTRAEIICKKRPLKRVKNDLNTIQNDPKTIQTRCKNDSKTIQKRSKHNAKTIQTQCKNDPKTMQKRSKNDPNCRSYSQKQSIFDRFIKTLTIRMVLKNSRPIHKNTYY